MQGKNKQLVQRDNARKRCSQNPDMGELAASCTKRLPPEQASAVCPHAHSHAAAPQRVGVKWPAAPECPQVRHCVELPWEPQTLIK